MKGSLIMLVSNTLLGMGDNIPTAWNNTAKPVRPQTFPRLFEHQVRNAPGLADLWPDHDTVRYAELEVRANRLAHLLVKHGAGPEGIVALLLPRSVDIVVAQLA